MLNKIFSINICNVNLFVLLWGIVEVQVIFLAKSDKIRILVRHDACALGKIPVLPFGCWYTFEKSLTEKFESTQTQIYRIK